MSSGPNLQITLTRPCFFQPKQNRTQATKPHHIHENETFATSFHLCRCVCVCFSTLLLGSSCRKTLNSESGQHERSTYAARFHICSTLQITPSSFQVWFRKRGTKNPVEQTTQPAIPITWQQSTVVPVIFIVVVPYSQIRVLLTVV